MTMTDAPRGRARADHPIRIDAVATGGYVWRITASNGRSIGRAAQVFDSRAGARASLDEIVAASVVHLPAGSVGHRPGGWGWTLADDRGRPVAHSPRTFERHGSCARSLARFRAALVELAANDER